MILLSFKRLLAVLTTLLVTSFIVFASLYLAPGDPVSFLLRGRAPTPEAVKAINDQYGFDKPFLTQYLTWIGNFAHGDMGRSTQYKVDVSSLIESRLPTTLQLLMYATTIIIIFGLGLGLVSALRHRSKVDHGIQLSLSALAATPAFVACIVLSSIFAVWLPWFPVFGLGGNGIDRLYHLTLPALALSASFIALVGRVTRSSVLDQMDREHVEVATSRGLTRPDVIRRHVVRNALGPIITVSGLLVASLIVASVVVESAFGLSGLGSLLVASVASKDFAVVQAIVMIVVFVFAAVNTIVAVLQPVIDPRLASAESAR